MEQAIERVENVIKYFEAKVNNGENDIETVLEYERLKNLHVELSYFIREY